MPLRLVVFDFDQTLSVVHVYNSIAGGREVWQLPAPHACSEAGQLARIVGLDRHPQLQQQGGFAMAAFGGAERVQRLAGMLEQLRQAGVECIICSRGLVGSIQKLLDQLGLLRYFSEVYGNIGDAYGQTSYDSQVRRSNLGDDVKYLGTRQQSEWGSKRDVMEKLILSRGIRPDEAIFVDDQSHEIKAMHGACRTLQVYPPCGIEQPHMNELLRHAPRRSMGTMPGASPGFVSPTGVAPALERRPSRGSGRWPSGSMAPEAQRPQQESFLAYAKPTTAGSGPGRRDAPKGKWLPSISNGRQEKTNRLLRSIWCCQS